MSDLTRDERVAIEARIAAGQPLAAFDYHAKGMSEADWNAARAFIEETVEDRARLLAALTVAEARGEPAVEPAADPQCSECDGQGWVPTTTADPLPSGEPGEPYQVQSLCPDCGGQQP